MTARSVGVVLFCVPAMLLLPNCGRSNTTRQQPPPQTHVVIIEGMQFAPADLTVRAEDTIVWVNKDLFTHTATAGDGAFDSKVIDPGKSWQFTPHSAGDFAYICQLHPTMKAMVRAR